MQVFNFHTHNPNEKYGIINYSSDFIFDKNLMYSIGIHPFNYKQDFKKDLDLQEAMLQNKNIVAIGETGFDNKSKVSLDLQKQIFNAHIQLSEKYEKPLIIHCVKYYNDLIQIKKKYKPKQQWIIHGFRSKIGIAKDLIRHGFYFSINEQVLKEKAVSLLKIIGLEKLFLETDDNETEIINIYNFVSCLFEIDLHGLKQQIEENLIKCNI